MARRSKKIEKGIAERIKKLSVEELNQVLDFAKKLLELEEASTKPKTKKGNGALLGKAQQRRGVRGRQHSF